MKKFTLIIVIALLSVSFGYGQGTEISYDDNEPTHYEPLLVDHVYAVRMSPDEPCEVLTLKYLLKKEGLSQAAFIGLVCAWEGDKPTATPVFQQTSVVFSDDWKEVEVDENVSQISIYNSIGEVVFVSDEIVPGINNIDISGFMTGLYFMRVESGNGPIIQKIQLYQWHYI